MTRSMWRVLSMMAVLVGTLSYTAAAYACDGSHPGDAAKAADQQKQNTSKFADFKRGHHGQHAKSDRMKSHDSFRFSTTLVTPDSGTCAGATWANDTVKRTYSVRTNSDGSYTLVASDRGTFTTLAGKSPGACDAADSHHGTNVTAGITGYVKGFVAEKIAGGTFNASATCAATCDRNAFVAAHFGASATQTVDKFSYVYVSKDPALTSHFWVNQGSATASMNRGDIATS